MSQFAEHDLPDYFPDDVELHLQQSKIFDEQHAFAEHSNIFYKSAHQAIVNVASPNLDNALLESAVATGVKAYEVVDWLAAPDKRYDELAAHEVILVGLFSFVRDIKRPDDFLRRLTVAGEHLESDAPRLNEVITEVVGYHVQHDPVAIRFARQGAAVMRAMHIYLDRKLAA